MKIRPGAVCALSRLIVCLTTLEGQRAPSGVLVIESEHDPDLPATACASRGCLAMPASTVPLPWARTRVVVLHGRSDPPEVIGLPVEHIAAVIRTLQPTLVVAESCFSARLELAEALVRKGWRGWLVGSTALLPTRGLDYPPGFWFGTPPAERSLWPRAPQGYEAHALYISPETVAEARAALEEWRRGYAPERGAEMLDWVEPPLHIVRVGSGRAFVALVPQGRTP